jgi:hypothetical protein
LVPALPLSLLLLGLDGASLTIAWSQSEVCPGAQQDLEQAIASYLHVEATELAAVEAAVRLVDAGPVGLRLELEIASQAGTEQHELAGPSCERLLDHAALLIAGAIDPFLYAWVGPERGGDAAAQQLHRAVEVQRPLAASQVVEEPQAIAVESELDPTDTVLDFGPLELAEPARDRPPIRGALGVGATTFVGLFPDPGGGVELEGALERGRLRWHSSVNGWFGGRFRATGTEVGGDLWALGFASALCGVPQTRRVHVPLCASAGAGAMSVRAVGTIDERRSTKPWAYAGIEARVLLLAREDLGIGLGIGAHAALVRPAWEVDSPGVRFRVPPVMGVLRLTVEARALGKRKRAGIKPD